MNELFREALDLFAQLLEIGAEHTEVLVASIIMVICVVIALVALLASVILTLPISIGYGIVRLCSWLYYRKHPEMYEYEDYDDYEEEPKKGKSRNKQDDSLTPVYPDWMNHKGGRLL